MLDRMTCDKMCKLKIKLRAAEYLSTKESSLASSSESPTKTSSVPTCSVQQEKDLFQHIMTFDLLVRRTRPVFFSKLCQQGCV